MTYACEPVGKVVKESKKLVLTIIRMSTKELSLEVRFLKHRQT